MVPEGCRRGSNEEGRVEELTRITKTPKWQRAPGERVTDAERGEERETRGRRKGLFINDEPARESAVFFVLGEKRVAHRRSQGDSRKNGKAAAAEQSVKGVLKRRSAFSETIVFNV